MQYNHFDMLPEMAFRSLGGHMTLEGGGGKGAQFFTSMVFTPEGDELLIGQSYGII